MKQMKQLQHSEKWLTAKGIADYCMVSRVTVRPMDQVWQTGSN
jgi:hypothetical protein